MDVFDTANGRYTAFTENGARLTADALVLLRRAAETGAELIYADEAVRRADGRLAPLFKPDVTPETLLSCNMVGSPLALSERLVKAASAAEQTDNYAIFLRACALTDRVLHLPRILAVGNGPAPADPNTVAAALKRSGVSGWAQKGLFDGSVQVRYGIRGRPMVSVITEAGEDAALLHQSLRSIEGRSAYRAYELIALAPQSPTERMRRYLDALRARRAARVLSVAGLSRAEAFHAGAEAAHGELLLFFPCATEIDVCETIMRMVELIQRPGMGAVGGLTLDITGRIADGGRIVGPGGGALCPYTGRPDRIGDAYMDRWVLAVHGVSALPLPLLTSRETFFSLSGFDGTFAEEGFSMAYCLRLYETGLRAVYTPYARFVRRTAEEPAQSEENRTRIMDVCRRMRLMGDPQFTQNPLFAACVRARKKQREGSGGQGEQGGADA